MTHTWIVVANSTTAKIFTTPRARLFNGHAHLKLIEELNHPKGRLRAGELIADNTPLNNYFAVSDPKKVEFEKFARELANILEQGRLHQDYEDLIVVAPAKFNGLLHKLLSSNVDHLVSARIEKDYTKMTEKHLGRCLSEMIH